MQIQFLVDQARRGVPGVGPQLREVLDRHPEIWQQYGDLARHATDASIRLIAAQDQAMTESLNRRLTDLRAELSGPSPSPLERLLIDRIAATWLTVHWCEVAHARTDEHEHEQAAHAEKRLDRAHRRHLSAIAALTSLRKLLPDAGGGRSRGGRRTPSVPSEDEPATAPMPTRSEIEPEADRPLDSSDGLEGDPRQPVRPDPGGAIRRRI
jgi:hypothetical protein